MGGLGPNIYVLCQAWARYGHAFFLSQAGPSYASAQLGPRTTLIEIEICEVQNPLLAQTSSNLASRKQPNLVSGVIRAVLALLLVQL